MRIAELQERRTFRLIEGAAEDPGPGEIQVRVTHVGICGSDLHYYQDGAIGDVTIRYPVVLGHEPSGTIVSAGAGVTGVSEGAKVLLEPAVYCYHCEFCHSGRHNVCENIRFFSTPPDPGFFREVMNVPAHNVLPTPENLDQRTATLFEPLAVVLHSLEFARPALGDTAAVFGAGPIGLLTIAALKASGAGRVWAIEPMPHRRELAKLVGADAVLDPAGGEPAKQILADTGKRGVDIAIDCATKGTTVQQAIDSVRSAGRIVITGIPGDYWTTVNFHVLRRKEAALFNVRRSNHETPAAIAMLKAAPERFAPLVTHTVPLDEISRGFEMIETGEGGPGKVVIEV
ncbi:MAG TPA: alcohol dehydrogenase catalytic domain-containing protein [Bryobacteraceae bacterium]|nr:alcohol dehydrogenase catalytic domain-containing protein [Bryobacteraceae bacterium]